MKQILPQELQKLVEDAIGAEQQISYANPNVYNALIAEKDSVTAVSASGRVSVGHMDVCNASIKVSQGNVSERDRFIEYISGDYTDEMFYALFKTGVTILKESGNNDNLCWVVTLVFKKINSEWKLVHRHNTRSTP